MISNYDDGKDSFDLDDPKVQGEVKPKSTLKSQKTGVLMRTATIVETVTKNVRELKEPVTLDNGAVYTGEWMNGVRDGHGVQIWSDGEKYEGQWANREANGKGKFTHVNYDIYDGEWLEDKAHG